LHVSHRCDLLIRRHGNVLIVAVDFIHGRFWDVGSEPFLSITGSGTLLASSDASDTDGGGMNAPRRSGRS
jgi:hypothetical protein